MIDDLEVLRGPNLMLRLIRPEDADYLYDLRMDPAYNRYLSQVTGDVEDQRRWIEDYKVQEADGRQLYFLILRHDGVNCGVVRLYDIGPDHFTWGSWILDHNKPAKAALESAFLSFSVGFEVLGKSIAHIDVRVANKHAEAFYRRFGMTETHSDTKDIFFTYKCEDFMRDRNKHLAALAGENR